MITSPTTVNFPRSRHTRKRAAGGARARALLAEAPKPAGGRASSHCERQAGPHTAPWRTAARVSCISAVYAKVARLPPAARGILEQLASLTAHARALSTWGKVRLTASASRARRAQGARGLARSRVFQSAPLH